MKQFEEYQQITKGQQQDILDFFKDKRDSYKEEIKELEKLKSFVASVRIPVYAEYSRDIPFIDVLDSLVKTLNFFPSTANFNNQLKQELTALRDKLKETHERIQAIEDSHGYVYNDLVNLFTYDREYSGAFHNRIDAIRMLNIFIKKGYFTESEQHEMADLFKLKLKETD